MIIIDIETSSADPHHGSILSIGAVELEHPEHQFYGECRLEDGAEIHPRALEVNGFTLEQIHDASKPSVRELMETLIAWYEQIDDRTIAGHNVGYFDLRYLEVAATRYGLGCFGLVSGNYRTIDLHTLAYSEYIRTGATIPMKNNLSNLSMDSALALVGLAPEPKPHNALNGAKLEAEAISRIMFGKPLFAV